MDPTTTNLAEGVIAILLTYLNKGAGEFARIAGKAAFEKVKNLFARLKTKWAGDKEASENLARFEEKPIRYRPVMEDILKEKLSKDKNLAMELSRFIEEIGPGLKIFQEMEEAEGVIGLKAREMKSGDATVIQKTKKAKDMTAVDIDKIG